MIYKLTQIHYQMQAEIYPDLSGRGDITQRRVKPYRIGESLIMQAPTWRHNSILNRWVNMYIIAKLYVKEKISR